MASWRLPKDEAMEVDPQEQQRTRGRASDGSSQLVVAASSTSKGGADKAQHKRKGKDKDEDEDQAERIGGNLKDHMVLLTKNSLNHSQQLRAVFGMTTTTFLVPAHLQVAVGALRAGATYDRLTKQRGPGHDLGMPHCHVAVAAVEGLVTDLLEIARTEKDDKHKAENATRTCEVLERLATALETAGQEHVHHLVPYFVAKPTVVKEKDKKARAQDEEVGGKVRLSFRIAETPLARLAGLPEGAELSLIVRRAMHDALVLVAGDRQGSAPRGEMERMLAVKLRHLQLG